MSMLSSVAERLYWMSRYLERTQDTARLIQAYNHLIMDIPKGAEPPWDIMIDILDAQPLFRSRFKAGSEQNVLKFLIADEKASCGIPFAVRAARENVRTTRDVLPEEAWELVNELHLFVEAHAGNASGRRNRHDFLSEVISRCQMVNGLLGASLPRDHAYGFIKLGRLVECADMTTRIMDVGAGDQGIMFGYACRETPSLMPAPIQYAHQIMLKLAELRHAGESRLGPDAKSQVTLAYDNGQPVATTNVVVSTQHAANATKAQVRDIVRGVVTDVLPQGWMPAEDALYCNPTGQFIIGGPVGDCGLTGRKIIVDTYGGMARHGGGAFSGKDPSKVDRSAAYAGRYVAKNIVAAGLAERCEIQVSYAIGVAEPTSIGVETYGTGKISDSEIIQLVREHFDLRPKGLIAMLDLKRPIYQQTAAYGHFGRIGDDFTWERTDKAEALAAAIA